MNKLSVVYHFVENVHLYRKTLSRFFKILTVRSTKADASSYGFWTDIHVQSS